MKILQLEKRIAELEDRLEVEKRKKLQEIKDLRQSLLKKYRDEVNCFLNQSLYRYLDH